LIEKAENGEADEQWLDSAERHLSEARAYFGDRRDLGDVQVADVSGYLTHLRTLSNGRGCASSNETGSRERAVKSAGGRRRNH
jgi:hypothetical protein